MSRVLGLPGEALPEGVPHDPVAEGRHGVALAGIPAALDELNHADPPAAAERPQHQPQSRRALALAGAGMDHEQALLEGLARHLGVLNGLALLHLLAVAGGIVDHGETPASGARSGA